MTLAHRDARLEALCDGVFAIALTLLILDVRLPSTVDIASTTELWGALRRLGPSIFAFVLSFGIILITWVNHHAILKLVHDSSASFIYANGLLLLTVVSIPFPTALLGAFLWTDHAAPAVVVYDSVLAVQALAWILVTGSALKNHLAMDERATSLLREGVRNGFVAFALYFLLAVTAWWFPVVVAIGTTASWAFWLVLSIRLKHT